MTTTTIATTCPYCGVGCGVNAALKSTTSHTTKNVADSVHGIKEHPANLGRLCVKGSSLHETIESPRRLLNPSINGETCDWDTALNTVAKTFQDTIAQHGSDSVAFYLSGQLLTEDYYVANKLMKGFIGSANVDTNSRLCMASAVVGYKRAFGADAVPCSYEDLEQTDLLVLIGSNAAWTHPVLYQRMVAAKKNRPHMKIVLIDPRKTASDDIADLHLSLKPSSDGFLFNGLLNYLIEHDFIDQAYIDAYTDGFDGAKAQTNSYSIEKTAEMTGLQIADLVKFFNWFSQNERVISFYSQGINQSSTGSDKCNAIINCHLATGKLGKVGSGPFSITGQPNAMGGREVGGLANQLAAHMDFADEDVDRVQRFWQSPTIATKPGLKAVDLYDEIHAGKIKAVWIMATNPAVSLPNSNKVREALDKCDFVVVSDYVENDTCAYADVKLPSTAWGEKDGTVTNSERCISRQRPLTPASGEAQHDWWQLTQVAQLMGFSQEFNYQCPADVFREHAELSGFENSEDQRLRDFDISRFSNISDTEYELFPPIQWPVNAKNPHGVKRLFTDNLFYTPNRKAQFITADAKHYIASVTSEMPLLLNTGRIRDQWHTMTRTGTSHKLLSHIDSPYIEVHPDDIKRYGVKANDFAVLKNQYGQYIGKVIENAGVRVGDVFSPIHWTDEFAKHGIVSAVTSPAVDPYSGQPESKATPVNIAPFQAHRWANMVIDQRFIEGLNTADFSYWYKAPCETGTRYFIGLSDDFSWQDFLQHLKPKDVHELQFNDQLNEDQRIIWLDGNDVILAIYSIPEADKLPSGNWLAQLLDKPIEGSAHHLLLGEQTPALKTVCTCFQVAENDIIDAIKDGCQSTELLGEKLKCGTNCGSCIPELNALIAQY